MPFRCLYENTALTFFLLVNQKLKAKLFLYKLWKWMNVNISNEVHLRIKSLFFSLHHVMKTVGGAKIP